MAIVLEKKVMEAGVMENRHAGHPSGDLEDARMKPGIVAEIVDIQPFEEPAVELASFDVPRIELLDAGSSRYGLPVDPKIRPERYVEVPQQRRRETSRAMGDVRPFRMKRRKPIEMQLGQAGSPVTLEPKCIEKDPRR